MMIALATIWGATFFSTAVALREMGALMPVAFRLGFGALGLWAIVLVTGTRVPRQPGVWAAFAVMGILNNVLPFSLITWGQQFIASGLASILNATTGVIGVFVAALLLADERMTPRKLLGACLAFLGVVVTIGPAALFDLDPRSLGQWAIIAATLSYSFAGVWARKMMGGVGPIMSATGMVTSSALVMWPVAIAAEGVPSFTYSAPVWAALVYQGLMATTCAYLLYYAVLRAAGSGNLMMVTLLLPPIAIILGVMFLGESLTLAQSLGFAIIAAGLIVVDGRLWHKVHSRTNAGNRA